MRLLVLAVALGLSTQACKTTSKVDSELANGGGAGGPMCAPLDLKRAKNPVERAELETFLRRMRILGNERAAMLELAGSSGFFVEEFYSKMNELQGGALLNCSGAACQKPTEEMVKSDAEQRTARLALAKAEGLPGEPVRIPTVDGKNIVYDAAKSQETLADVYRKAMAYNSPDGSVKAMTSLQVLEKIESLVEAAYQAESNAQGNAAERAQARYNTMFLAMETMVSSGAVTSSGGEAVALLRGMKRGMVTSLEQAMQSQDRMRAEIARLESYRAEIGRAFSRENGGRLVEVREAVEATGIDKLIEQMKRAAGSPAELERLRGGGRERLEAALDFQKGREAYERATGVKLDREAMRRVSRGR